MISVDGKDLNEDGFWGPEIEVNGVRPKWLKGRVVCALHTGRFWACHDRVAGDNPAEGWAWSHTHHNPPIPNIVKIRLPADHQYYTEADKYLLGEHIVAAACRKGELIISMPQPARHHHILHAYHDLLDPEFKIASDSGVHIRGHEQGFLTNTGRYVDRVEGLEIAERNDQIIEKNGNPGILFSEDMW